MTAWLTGDTHGENAGRFSHRRHGFLRGLTADDVVVVLGDTGLMWPGAEAETLHFLKQMEGRPYQVIFLFGNHDNYDWAETLPEVDAFGGRLRQVVAGGREWPGRYVCSDWAVLDLAGEHCLLCAHADSHDADLLFDRDDKEGMREARRRHQWYRIRHWSWWPQEALDLGAFGAFAREHAGERFDAVLTHDCPAIIHERLPRGDLAGRPVTAQEELFDELRRELDFGVWAHGHMHRDDLAYCDEKGVRLFCLYGGFRSIGELRDVASRPMAT